MGMTRARLVGRWVLEALLAALLLGTLGLAGLAHLVPASGHPVLLIRSGSMTPTIPVGAAVVLDSVRSGEVHVGDVVTMRLANGAIFTHRVTRLASVGGVPYIETRGDANPMVDPALTPVSSVIGRVTLTLPLAGFLMAGLAMPVGLATVLLAALTLCLALWLLDEDEDLDREARPIVDGVTGRRARLHLWAR
jgi:signal peptidase I